MKALFAGVLLAMLGGAACASDAQIRAAVAVVSPAAKITSITKSPAPGWYEVVTDEQHVLYAEENGRYVLLGNLLDIKQRRDLTQEKTAQLAAATFNKLPFKDAIKIVQGNGKRRLVVFSDPDCPYCRRVEQELVKLKDVTIYTFLYPLSFHKDAARKAGLIWCAKDQVKTWRDLMLHNKEPEGDKVSCATPIDRNIALGEQLGVEGTPALMFANGQRLPGMAPAQRIEAMLSAAD